MKRIIKSVLLASLVSLVVVEPAFAYIDPTTGGMLVQILGTAFALLSGVALIFSRQIRTVFARLRRRVRRAAGGDAQMGEEPGESAGPSIEVPREQ